MIKHLKQILLIIVITSSFSLYSEIKEDNTLFYKDKKVDNDFLDPYVYPGDSTYFQNFFALDSVFSDQLGCFYGIGSEKGQNVGYYFDVRRNSKFLGYNEDTQERALKLVDKTAVTSSGRAYIIDCIDEIIYYWNVYADDTFLPHGSINNEYIDLEDIYTTENGDLYILDAGAQKIEKYSTQYDSFLNFDNNQDFISYGNSYSSSWGAAKGLVVSNNKIFLLFSRGQVIKLSQNGVIEKRFRIGMDNIGLNNSSNRATTETYTNSIAVGLYGNIYILDSKNESIHILNDDLDYISTWSNPEIPIYDNATDISFSPNNDYLFISHPWGFYANRYNLNSITGVSLDNNIIYPDYISDYYQGVNLEYSVIGSGIVSINLEGQSQLITLEQDLRVDTGNVYSVLWDGKNNYGEIVPYGTYQLNIILNGEVQETLQIEVKEDNNLTVIEPDDSILRSNNIIDYQYSLQNTARINIKLKEKDKNDTINIMDRKKSAGTYSLTMYADKLGRDAVDGVYEIIFTTVPDGLSVPLEQLSGKFFEITLDRTNISFSNITLSNSVFNPNSDIYNTIESIFSISEGANVTIQVFDTSGNLVDAPITDTYYPGGTHNIPWDGKLPDNSIASDGDYYFKVTVDQAELAAPIIKNSQTFTIDTIPPEIVFSDNSKLEYFLSPNSISSVNLKDELGTDEVLSFTVNEPTTIDIKVKNSSGQYIKTIISDTAYETDETCNVTWDCTNNDGNDITEGPYVIEIKVTDLKGLVTTELIIINIDNSVTTTITSPTTGSAHNENFDIEGYATDPNILKYKLSYSEEGSSYIPLLQVNDQSKNGNLYSVDITNLTKDTNNTFKLELWDYAGNYTHDSIMIYRPFEISDFFNGFDINGEAFSILNIPIINITLLKNSNINLSLINSSGEMYNSTSLGSVDSITGYSYDISGISDGEYTLKLDATYRDYTYSYERSIIIDNTPPILSFNVPSEKYSNETDINLTLTVSDTNLKNYSVSIEKDHQIINTLYSGSSSVTNHSIDFSAAATDEGSYSLVLSAEDEAGNSSFIYTDITIDRTPPVITLAENSLGEYYLSPNEESSIGIQDAIDTNYPLSFSVDETSNISVELLSADLNTIKTIIVNSTVSSGVSNEITWNGKDSLDQFVEDGRYTLRINATDEYSNTNTLDIPVYIDNNAVVEGENTIEIIESSTMEFAQETVLSKIIKVGDNFLIAYVKQDAEQDKIYGQFLDSNGNKIGNELLFDQQTLNSIDNLKLVTSDLGFNILWNDDIYGGLYCKMFSYSGVSFGDSFKIEVQNSSSYSISEIKDGYVIVTGGIDLQSLDTDLITEQYVFDKDFQLLRRDDLSREETNSFLIRGNTKGYSSITRKDFGYTVIYAKVEYIDNYNFESTFISQDFDFNGDQYEEPLNLIKFTANFNFLPQLFKTEAGFSIKFQHNTNVHLLNIGGEYYTEGSLINENVYVGSNGSLEHFSNGFMLTYINENNMLNSIFFDENSEVIGAPHIQNTNINNYSTYYKNNILFFAMDGDYTSTYKNYKINDIPPGVNLTAHFSEPDEDELLIYDNLRLSGSVIDANFDRYRIIQSDNSATDDPIVLMESQNSISEDELCIVDLFSMVKNNEYDITLEAWDKAGNYRSDNITVTRAYDPNDFILDYGISNRYISNIQPGKINLSLVDFADVNIIIYDENGLESKNIPLTNINTLTNYEIDISGLDDGNYQINVSVEYNEQFFNSSSSIVIDNTAPNIQLAELGLIIDDTILDLVIEEENISTYSVILFDSESEEVTTLKEGTTEGNINGVIISPNNLVDDNYTLQISVDDKNGNSSSITEDFVIDKVVPLLSLEEGTKNNYFISPNQISSSGTLDDIGSGENIEFSFNEDTTVNINIKDSNDNEVRSYPESLFLEGNVCSISWNGKSDENSYVPDGSYAIYVNYHDSNNNSGTKIFTVDVDNTNPVAEIDTHSGQDITISENLNINGSVSDSNLDHYTLKLIDPNGVKTDLVYGSINKSGLLAVLDEGDLIKDTEYNVVLEVIDKAGNINSDNFNVTRPYSLEEFILEFDIENSYSGLLNIPKVDLQLLEASEVTLELLNLENNSLTTFNIGSTVTLDNHIIDITGLLDGIYEVTVTAQYKSQVYSKTDTITIDNSDPIINLIGLSDYYSNQENIELSATIDEDSLASYSVQLLDAEENVLETLQEGNNTSIITYIFISPNTLVEGDYYIKVNTEDSAKNTNSSMQLFTVDRTNPTITLDNPLQDSVVSGSFDISGSVSDASGITNNEVFFITNNNTMNIISSNSNDFTYTLDSSNLNDSVLHPVIRIVTTDSAGNAGILEKQFVIDNQPPEPFIDFQSLPYVTDETTFISSENNIVLSASTNDDVSVIDSILYSINNGEWMEYSDPFSIETEGTYIISYKASDDTGNWSDSKEITLSIDNKNPSVNIGISEPKYVLNEKTFIPLNNSVEVVAIDNQTGIISGINNVKYSYDNIQWNTFTGDSIEFSNEGIYTLYVEVTDNVGNSTIENVSNIIVDVAPPATTLETDSEIYHSRERNIIAYNTEGTLSLSSIDLGSELYQSGVYQTYLNINGNETVYDSPVSIILGQEYNVSYYSTDNVGNSEISNNVIIAVDNTPPEIVLNYDSEVFIENDYIYTKPGTNFSLTATDNFAGVKNIYSKTGDNEFSNYLESFSYTDEIDILYSYYSEDNISNYSNIEQINISIDNTPPLTTQAVNKDIVVIGEKYYADTSYLFQWVASDNKSGVKETIVKFNGSVLEDNQLQIVEDGDHVIEYYSIDKLGHIEETNTFYVTTPIPDRTAPTTTITHTYEPYTKDTEYYFRSDVVIGLNAQDLMGGVDSYASGVNETYYKINSETVFRIYNEPITFNTGIHTLKFYSIDNVGNIEELKTQGIIIDDNSPDSSISFPTSDSIQLNDAVYINNHDTIEINAIDDYSGVQYIYYRINGNEQWQIYNDVFSLDIGTYTIEYYSKDNLGNQETVNQIDIEVKDYYSSLKYRNIYDYTLYNDIKSHNVSLNSYTYILDDHLNHIYVSQLDSENRDIFDNAVQITSISKNRTSLDSNGNYIAVVEADEEDSNIYLYNTEDSQQEGIQLTYGGLNSNPVFFNDYIYWINTQNDMSSVVEYNIITDSISYLLTTEAVISKLMKLDSDLGFIIKNNSEYFYVIDNNNVKLIYESDSSNTLSFTYTSNLIAIEEESGISLIDTNENEVVRTINGNKPIFKDDKLFFLQQSGNGSILCEMSLWNDSPVKIALGKDIKDIQFGNDGTLLYSILKNPQLVDEFNRDFYTISDESEYTTDYLNNLDLYNLVIKDMPEVDELVTDITCNNSFVLHTSINEGDVIYQDTYNFLFPEILPPFETAWYLDTSNNLDFSFTAQKDLTILLLVDSDKVDQYPDYEIMDLSIISSSSAIWHTVASEKKYILLSKEFNTMDTIEIYTGNHTIRPMIFLIETNSLESIYPVWEPQIPYNENEIVIYGDQLYLAEYYAFNRSPLNGHSWKRIDLYSTSQEWDKLQTYYEGEIVIYKGLMYKAKWYSFNDKPTNGNPWQCISSVSNILFWDNKQSYPAGSVVSYMGDIYISEYYSKAKKPDNGLPWRLLSDEVQEWNDKFTYRQGDIVSYKSKRYEAKWYNVSNEPGFDEYGPWNELP